MKLSLAHLTALLLAPLAAMQAAESTAPAPKRNLTTDEPLAPKGKPAGASDYVPKTASTDGRHLALTMQNGDTTLNIPAQDYRIVWIEADTAHNPNK
jgi:hypothetical protein